MPGKAVSVVDNETLTLRWRRRKKTYLQGEEIFRLLPDTVCAERCDEVVHGVGHVVKEV